MSLQVGARRGLTVAVLCAGCLLLVSMMWALRLDLGSGLPASSSQAYMPNKPISQAPGDQVLSGLFQEPPGVVLAQTPINCTLETTSTTTTDTSWNNHDFDTNIQVSNYTDLSLISSVGDVPGALVPTEADFFRLDNAVIGAKYTIQAKPDRTLNYNLGVRVYDKDQQEIIIDIDTSTYYATVTLIPDDYGPYYIEVFQVSAQCTGDTYSLIYNYTSPTPTPSPTATGTPYPTATPRPGSTWMTGFDQYEPNFDFNIATTIAPGLDYDMNFVPWGGGDVDNDFLKVRVKSGLQLTCETSNLDPAVDPRMAFYSGPGEQYYIMANDDIELGDFNSRLSYYVTHEGYVYILIGQGTRMDARDTANSDYTVTCDLAVPGTTPYQPGQGPTPNPDKDVPTPVPTPTPQVSVVATPTPPPVADDRELTFRLVTRPSVATPTPEPSGFRTFRVVVYFDIDQDGVLGAGEGVTGFFVQVLSPDGRRELAEGYTDDQGQLSFTVPTIGTVRIVVPLLGVDRLIESSKPEVKVRIAPATLPDVIP